MKFNQIDDRPSYEQQRFNFIKKVEGCTSKVYVDSEGKLSIGIGYNLQVSNVRGSVLSAFGFDPKNTNLTNSGMARELYYQNKISEITNKDYPANLKGAALQKVQDDLNAIMKERANDELINIQNKKESFSFSSDGEVKAVFDKIIINYENEVDKWANNESLSTIPDSQERIALTSLAYNNPTLLGSDLAKAICSDDRAEAWFEIRYRSNANAISGLANRRCQESELFGLTNDSEMTYEQASQVQSMYEKHKQDIDLYESRYSKYVPDIEVSTQKDGSILITSVLPDKSWKYDQVGTNGEIIHGTVNKDGSYIESCYDNNHVLIKQTTVSTNGSWEEYSYDPETNLIKKAVVNADGTFKESILNNNELTQGESNDDNAFDSSAQSIGITKDSLKSLIEDEIRRYSEGQQGSGTAEENGGLNLDFKIDTSSRDNDAEADKLAENLIPKTSTMLADSDDSGSDQALVEAWQNAQARTELVSTLKSILDEEQDTQIINVHPSEDNAVTFTFDNGKTYSVHSDSSYDYARQDGNGDIVSGHVNADGSWMEQVSTADGTPVSSQAVNTDGSWTANTYDPNGYLIKQVTTDQDGNVTDTTYNAQEAAARAAYEQALKDTAPIGYAATLGEALANGDGLNFKITRMVLHETY